MKFLFFSIIYLGVHDFFVNQRKKYWNMNHMKILIYN